MAFVRFEKMQGAGNDFLLVDNRASVVSDADKPAFARYACPRALAVGADGIIFLEEDPEYDFAWSFWNADGSEAEMCGNGARCVALYARKIGAAGDRMAFRTLAGPIHAEIVDGGARVRMTDATRPERIDGLGVDPDIHAIYFVNTGVPHAVAPVADLEAVDLVRLGRTLRMHERFAPAGTNADFIAREGPNAIAMRTYERGVEAETLACGTGAVASAIVATVVYDMTSPVQVRTRSGADLSVDFVTQETTCTDIFLQGPAACVYEGRLEWCP